MPQMANITVKNVALADVTYVAKVPSAGDRTPAKWTQDAAHAVPAFRPALALGTKDDASGRRRIGEVNFAYPIVQAVNGVDTLADKVTFSGTFSLPKYQSTVITKEAIYQLGNLLVAALVRDALEQGYAPT